MATEKTADEKKDEEKAQQLFAAFNDAGARPWRTFENKEVSRKWESVSEDDKDKWIAAAGAWTGKKDESRQEEKVAEKLFLAFNDAGKHPWRTFENREVPRKWEGVTEDDRNKWFAAARAAINSL